MAAAPRQLCLAQSKMAVAQEIVGVVSTFRMDGDADADPDAMLPRAGRKRRFERARNALGELCDRLVAIAAFARNGEFVSAKPGNDSAVARLGFQPTSDGLQHKISGGMAEHVVDALEAVKPDHEQRDLARALPRIRDLADQSGMQRVAVGKTGQCVVLGEISDAFGLTLADRDIAQDGSVLEAVRSLPAREARLPGKFHRSCAALRTRRRPPRQGPGVPGARRRAWTASRHRPPTRRTAFRTGGR